MLAFDAPVPPSLDLRVDLLVEVGHRARAHPRAPERFRDVLHAPHRNAGQIHLDQRLLDRALPPPVAFDDRSLKGLAPQLRDLEIDLAGTGLQRPLVAASPGILPSLAAFVTPSSAKLVRLSIQHGVQRLFNSPTNHLAKMVSIRASSIWITWPIGFSSLIGCSFILEEAVNPESAKDSVRYRSLLPKLLPNQPGKAGTETDSERSKMREMPMKWGLSGIERTGREGGLRISRPVP